jgi:hypothetical protein
MSTEATAPLGGAPRSGHAAVASSNPDHRMLRHWLPWLLPNAAIGLATLSLLFAQVFKNEWDLIAQSVHRGDFLIPIIIICTDAFLRWQKTTFGNVLTAFIATFFGCLSCLFVAILLLAYGFIASSPSSSGASSSADFANIITWASFGVGFLAGTLALWETRPRKAETSPTRPQEAGTSA